jgi:hypothetical protein
MTSLDEYYLRVMFGLRYTSCSRLDTSSIYPSLEITKSAKVSQSLPPPHSQDIDEAAVIRPAQSTFKWRLARFLGRSSSSPAFLNSGSSRSKASDKAVVMSIVDTSVKKHEPRKPSGTSASGPESPRGSETDIDESRELGSSFRDDSSEGSEVEVEGGVAVTEEAVEEHIPDIITQA